MKKTIILMAAMMLSALTAMAAVSINEVKGWYEGGYVKWTPVAGATSYDVYVRPEGGEYQKLDNELVRNYGSYCRADIVGLKAGNYQFRIVPCTAGTPIAGEETETTVFTAVAYDRAGFAHQGRTEGVGAYNNDGTLKANAVVIYVYANNASTVTARINAGQKVDSEGNLSSTGTVGPEKRSGLQNIIAALEKGKETRPINIRIIGTVKATDMDEFGSKEEGLQIKGKEGNVPMNITVEGIGDDAAIHGFGILARNVNSGEFRNFAIMYCLDDCLSLDTDNHYIWTHNMDFFYGKPGSASDQVKGDGTFDVKGKSSHITVSYNHFIDSGKSSLGGMKSETTDCLLTYHHNWFDHSDSRHPRIRTMTFHIYNNYYDGNSKYGVGMTYGGSAYVENNYFRNVKYPMLISLQGTDATGSGTFSGEKGGVIKAYGNYINACKRYKAWTEKSGDDWDAYEVENASDPVPANIVCKAGGTAYNNFDTNGTLAYTYNLDKAEDVKNIVTAEMGAGRQNHGDFKWQFNNAVEDQNDQIIDRLKSEIIAYRSALVGFFDGLPQQVLNGGYTEGERSGGDAVKNEDYVPSDYKAPNGDPVIGGGDSEDTTESLWIGGANDGYYLFNVANDAQTQQYLADGSIVISSGSLYNNVANGSNDTLNDPNTGSLQLAKETGTATFHNDKGITRIDVILFRTGSFAGAVKAGDALESMSEISKYSGTKGTSEKSFTMPSPAKYVTITNTATGTLHIHGVKIYVADGTDGIENITTGSVANSVFYDLQGRRISHPVKGQLIIANGKKFIVK